MIFYNDNKLTLTYIPLNEIIGVNDFWHRSMFRKRNLAIKILRSHLWAYRNGIRKPLAEDSITFDYDFPDDMDLNDMLQHRKRNQ